MASIKKIFAEVTSGESFFQDFFKETPSKNQAFLESKTNITIFKTQSLSKYLFFTHHTKLICIGTVALRSNSLSHLVKSVKDSVLTNHKILKTNQKERPHTNEDVLKNYTGRLRLCHKISFFPMLLFDLISCFFVKHA